MLCLHFINKKNIFDIIGRKFFLVFFNLFLLSIPLAANEVSVDEQYLVKTMKNMLSNSRHPSYDQVWPKFDMKALPTIITFKNGHVYAFDLPSNDSRWAEINIDGETVLFSEIDHWGVTQYLFTLTSLEGHHAVVLSLDINDMYMFMVFTHEKFHLFQHANFEANLGQYEDHLNQENIVMMHLEAMILEQYLKADHQGHEHQNEILKDYIAIRKARSQMINTSSLQWEDDQQKWEGTADYVAHKNEQWGDYIGNFNQTDFLLHALEETRTTPNQCDSAIKWRHYPVGTILALALDYLEVPNWKQLIGSEKENLFHFLERALPMNHEELEERINGIKATYDLNSIRQFVGMNLQKYTDDINDALSAFHMDPGVELFLGRSEQLRPYRGGGQGTRTFYLPSGSNIGINRTGGTFSTKGEWSFQTNKLPYILIDREGNDRFKIERGVVIEIDSHKITVQELVSREPFTIDFENLSWQGPTTSFESKGVSGKMTCHDGKLFIAYPN